jgi:hypothetical protein
MKRKYFPFLLFALLASILPRIASGHEIFYLRDDGSFSAFNPVDSLSVFPPESGTLLDFDGDGYEGLTIFPNYSPSNPLSYQMFTFAGNGIDRVISGTVEVHLFSRLRDGIGGTGGSLFIALGDDSASIVSLISTPVEIYEDPWGIAWNEKTAMIPVASYTLKKGHNLVLLVWMGAISADPILLAYDTVQYPSLVIIPTITKLVVSASADSIPASVYAGDKQVNLLTISLDPGGASVVIDSLEIAQEGSGDPNDVGNAYLWEDSGPQSPGRFDSNDDVLIGSAVYNSGVARFTNLGFILSGNGTRLFAAQDVPIAAPDGDQVGTSITGPASIWSSADTVESASGGWPQPDTIRTTTIINPNNTFVINEVATSYDYVMPGQVGINLLVVVTNSLGSDCLINSGGPTFTLNTWDDRAADYTITADPFNPVFVANGTTDTLSYLIDVNTSALLDSTIILDAAYDVLDLGNGTTAGYAGALVKDAWTVIRGTFRVLGYLYDTRNTPERWDDSLAAFVQIPGAPYDSVIVTGSPFGGVVQQDSSTYRMVLEINPNLAPYDYDADLSGDGYWAITGVGRGFASATMPTSDKEMIVTQSNVPDSYLSPIDHLRGFTAKSKPAVPWNPLTDPFTEPGIDQGKTSEVATITTLPAIGGVVDCVDGGTKWEITKTCDPDRYFISELWFRPDMDWIEGDTADVYFHMQSDGANSPWIEKIFFPIVIQDEDTTGPEIITISPQVVTSADSIYLAADIRDPSGVYDDSTGSGGQGVYVLWDTDGELSVDAVETTLSRVSGDTFASDVPIPPQPPGTQITYEIHAFDDDFDGARPADRSPGVSGLDTVFVLAQAALIDSSGTLYPARATTADSALSLHIGINNLSSLGVMLDTSSIVSFTDGANTFVSHLANPTYITPNARDFTLTFAGAPVPALMSAPRYYDLVLQFVGIDDLGNPFVDSLSTAGRNAILIDAPKITVTPVPLDVIAVHAGADKVPLLAMRLVNEFSVDQPLDSLLVTNLSNGPGTRAQIDSEVDSLFLVIDADGDIAVSPADSIVSVSSFVNGAAVFVVTGKFALGPSDTTYLLVAADVDSSLARDPDRLDAVVSSPGDFVFGSGAEVADTFSPLYPLDSFGYALVDGMVSHQVTILPGPADTLYAGSTGNLLAAIRIPQNGYAADTLHDLSLKNYANTFDPSDFAALKLYADDGDGSFSPASDPFIGEMVFSGDRYERSGIDLPISGRLVLFVVGDVASTPIKGSAFQPGIPIDGIQVASANDGPLDGPVIVSHTYLIVKIENIAVTGLPLVDAAAHPGSVDLPILYFSLANNTRGNVRLDSLLLTSLAAGKGTSPELDGETATIRVYEDDGDGVVGLQDNLLGSGYDFSGGKATLDSIFLDIPPDSSRFILVTCDVDSFCSADGDTLGAAVAGAADLAFDSSYAIAGSFPVAGFPRRIIDGMLAHQITVNPRMDSLVVTETKNILVFDFSLPGNGYRADTLKSLRIFNNGSASTEHFALLTLYRDGGDGTFDGGSGDDAPVGTFISIGGKYYQAINLNEPLPPGCNAETRFFVAADLNDSFSSGASIQFGIPLYGVQVASGNDGPIDSSVIDPFTQFIPKPDQITIFPYSVGDKNVYPGGKKVLNFGVGCYNGFSTPLTLFGARLFQDGSALDSEIDGIYAFTDADGDGLFNAALDSLLDTGYYADGYYRLDAIDLELAPRKITYLFIAYDLGLNVRDSVSIDLQINGANDVTFSKTTADLQGEFPINSPGTDYSDGMTSKQIALGDVPSYRAAFNELDILALDVTIPSNGMLSDELKSLAVNNMGTALAGRDVAEMKLWKESGIDAGSFDPADDTFMAYLYWNGFAWKSTPLSEFIPTGGLHCYVTFSTSSTPVDGVTFRASIPIGGIEVLSGNDGPIDKNVVNNTTQIISTDELLAYLHSDSYTYSTGQNMRIEMTVKNQGPDTLRNIVPSNLSIQGTGGTTLVSGPSPPVLDLAPGGDSTFVWIFLASGTGDVYFCGEAATQDSSYVSTPTCTDSITIQSSASALNLALSDLSPVAVNKGQENVSFLKATLTFDVFDSTTAPVLFNGLKLWVKDSSGPVQPSSVLGTLTMSHSQGGQSVLAVTDTTPNPVTLVPTTEIEITPGSSLVLNVFADIADTTTAPGIGFEIESTSEIDVVDKNSGLTIPLQSQDPFPWKTATAMINSPAESIAVTCEPNDTICANISQQDVSSFLLHVYNDSPPDGANALVTNLRISFHDSAGASLAPAAVCSKITFKFEGASIQTSTNPPPSGDWDVTFSNPPAIPPLASKDLEILVDIADAPGTDAFFMTISDAGSITAKDDNSGALLPVENTGDFPLVSRFVMIQRPASGARVSYTSDFAPQVLPLTQSLAPLCLMISHNDTTRTSSIVLDSLAVSFVDTNGLQIHPGDYFQALYIVCGPETVAADTALGGTSNVVELPLTHGIDVAPAATETLTVFLNVKGTYDPSSFALMVAKQDLHVFDKNDGSTIYDLDGAFPIVSNPGFLTVPSSNISARIVSLLPANITARQSGMHAFDLLLSNDEQPGFTDAEIARLRVNIRDEDYKLLNPADFVASAAVTAGDSTVVTADVGPSGITFYFPNGAFRIQPSTTDTLGVVLDMNAALTNKNISFTIEDSASLEVKDCATGASIPVVPAVGTYPLATLPTHILGQDVRSSFTNYPNPFAAGREFTTITFYVPVRSDVSLKLYTIWGKRIITLIDHQPFDAGLLQTCKWDGRNADGQTVNNGVYYLELEMKDSNGRTTKLKRKVGVIR